jgi:hypothetical protein
VIAWPDRRDGRKLTAGSALFGPGGHVLAAARAVWLTVPRPVPPRAVPDQPAVPPAAGQRPHTGRLPDPSRQITTQEQQQKENRP